MKALIKTKKGPGNVELTDLPEPDCGACEIKIKVKTIGICGTDLHIQEDSFPNYYPPVILGHEFSGKIVEIGSNVENVKKLSVGDRIVVLPSAAIICGECSYCKSGNFIFCPSRRGMGHGTDGAMTEYVCVREDLVYKLSENISYAAGAMVEPLACCVQAVDDFVDILPSHHCLVSGPGPIGLLVLLLLKLKKARVILSGISKDKKRLETGSKIGADLAVNSENEDTLKMLYSKFNIHNFDICFECSGAGASLINCIDYTRKMGSLVQVGLFSGDIKIDFNNITFKQLAVFGSLGFNWGSWDKSLNILKNGLIDIDPLITHRYGLEDWEKAFEKSRDPDSLKVIIEFS